MEFFINVIMISTASFICRVFFATSDSLPLSLFCLTPGTIAAGVTSCPGMICDHRTKPAQVSCDSINKSDKLVFTFPRSLNGPVILSHTLMNSSGRNPVCPTKGFNLCYSFLRIQSWMKSGSCYYGIISLSDGCWIHFRRLLYNRRAAGWRSSAHMCFRQCTVDQW